MPTRATLASATTPGTKLWIQAPSTEIVALRLSDWGHAAYVSYPGTLSTATPLWEFGLFAGSPDYRIWAWDGLAARIPFVIQPSGNVGMGTTAPDYKLEVRGSSSRNTLALFGDGDGVGYAGIKIGALTTTAIATNRTSQFNLHMRKDNWYGGDGSGPSFIIESVSKVGGFAAPFLITPTNDVILNGGTGASGLSYGNVGIGTTNPGYKLDVQGGSINTGGGLCIAGDCKTAWSQVGGGTASQWTTSGPNIYYNGGNVGIGTTTPTFLLDVKGSANTPLRVRDSADREYLSTTARTGTLGTVPVVSLAGSRLIIDNNGPEGGNDTVLRHTVNSLVFNPSDTTGLPGAFIVRQVGGGSILYVDQNTNGNIGIGTTAPTAKLHVAGDGKITGNLTVDGNIAAKYQDVAEWVPASEHIPAGAVVVLDPNKSNQVVRSAQAYDTRVAGVISEQPGIALGESGSNKVLVATTGRVKIKVDATRSPIHIGDLLVTSDISGMAMKSEPVNIGGVQIHRPGTLIGKALEPLAKGRGEILVLLSLQ